MKPIFYTLREAITWIAGPRAHNQSRRFGGRSYPFAHGRIEPVYEPVTEKEKDAVDAIDKALRAGTVHARGSLPNGMGKFEDIPIEFWQYALLDLGRSVNGGRSPIAEQSHAMPVLCYDRIILWREEVERHWPKPVDESCIMSAAPIAPSPMPWWRRLFGWRS